MGRKPLPLKRILINDIVVILDTAPYNYYRQRYEGLLGVVVDRRPRRGGLPYEVFVRFQGMREGSSACLRSAWVGIVVALGDHTHSSGANPIYDRVPELIEYPHVSFEDRMWRPIFDGKTRRPKRFYERPHKEDDD